ncbi:MAG: tRNA uridine-5-carboxymethylaminomethyl(34) synthesis GTPase MnmE [Clostridia bacterium]|nr:tRNA uridine-5-carboxymethylaminomethyl(34) synthesis GTPase MnmE [Clostridia bacterium]
MSTIAAISSPIGAGGIGIVRVSGEDALRIADAIFDFAHKRDTDEKSCLRQLWQPLYMHFGTFNAQDFKDVGYAVYFPAKQAYTGEDTVEFYLHGGVRIMQGALDTLLANGAVMAKNGEFTKRAFLSGRLSLADAEGVIDMINAESAAGLRAAYRLMEGDVAKRINAILDKLEELIATIEATLDYPDEMEDEVLPNLENNIKDILVKVKDLIASAKNGKIAKYGLTVALAGNPNAGKSSLMNALLKENRAIVTPVAGTTRDTVEDSFEYDGVKITLVDTAGLRESKDIVESEGIERAKRAIESADVVLHVIDSTADDKDDIDFGDKLVFDVYNKCDISNERNVAKDNKSFVVSAKTGEGVESIAKAIASLFKENKVEGGELITSKRHVSALYQAKRALESAFEQKDSTLDIVLIDLTEAYNALGEITGKTATETVIDSIFSRFCVGK